MEKNQGVLKLDLLCLCICDEVWRYVTPVKLHPFDDIKLMVQGLSVRNGDGPILANFLESLRDHAADLLIAVGGDSCNALDALGRTDGSCLSCQILKNDLHSLVHAALDIHWVHASGNCLATLTENCARQDCGGGGPIPSHIVGLARNRLDKLRPDIDHGPCLQLNGLGHGHAVLGDFGSTKGLLYDHIPALWSHGHGHGVSQAVATIKHQSPGFASMPDVLG
mmetsp:Transcript_130663/g.317350  ORF Transcript_130663/g.317350 Transcript_130663/m.317350 type:complete len:223 (-) Transcript_130663:151-819(-)